jgi:LysM repeat protein
MEESSTPTSHPSSFVPVAIALVGIVLGAVAIFLHFSGQGKAGEIEERLVIKLQEHADSRAEVDKAIADLSRRIDLLAEADSSRSSQIRNLATQVQGALDQVRTSMDSSNRQIMDNREKLIELADAVEKLATTRTPAPAPSSSSPSASASGSGSGGDTEEGIHVIRAGDTFARLAQQYGVSLDAIINANPTVNPNRLQIGQRIVIPGR